MVFIAAFWCDGACRNNGQVNKNKPVIGGAGVYYPRAGTVSRRKQLIALPPRLVDAGAPTATGNRAKLHALVLALETALKVKSEFYSDPFFRVYININSDYVTSEQLLTTSHIRVKCR